MANSLKFGECLKMLLLALDISMSRLAKAINVDSSLVNRWIHDKRVPQYNTSYIANISEYLSKNIQNEFQLQRLNKFFLNASEPMKENGTIKEKISTALSLSQGYSFECRRNTAALESHSSSADSQSCLSYIPLSSEDKIVIGRSNVFNASVHLLRSALNKSGEDNNTIYISYNNDLCIAGLQSADLFVLQESILNVLQNGWKVLFFVRLSTSWERIIKIIHFAKPLIKTGRFIPYYLKKYDIFSTGKENISIPGVGAISCYSSKPNSALDHAFYFQNKMAVTIISKYFENLLKTHAHPIFTFYSIYQSIEYGCNLAESEESIGNKFLYKYGFSMVTFPPELYVRLLRNSGLTNDEFRTCMEYYGKRRDSFLSNIKVYEHKDIYFEDSVKYLIRERKFYLYCFTGIKIIELEIDDIIELLQNIIFLLEEHIHYNISFIPGNTYVNCEFYCYVKERHSVSVEAYEPFDNTPVTRLSMKEPMMIRAMEEYFKEMWEHIAPVNKDKGEVIRWIKKQIRLLGRYP